MSKLKCGMHGRRVITTAAGEYFLHRSMVRGETTARCESAWACIADSLITPADPLPLKLPRS